MIQDNLIKSLSKIKYSDDYGTVYEAVSVPEVVRVMDEYAELAFNATIKNISERNTVEGRDIEIFTFDKWKNK